jgi:hypothetical protein
MNTNWGSISFANTPLVLNSAGQNANTGMQPVAGGFNFMLPLSAANTINRQAMQFTSNALNNQTSFVGQQLAMQQQGVNNSMMGNQALGFQSANIINSYLQNMASVMQNSNNNIGNTGGLFGGGGFLGLGL